jgi:hypothetical protein
MYEGIEYNEECLSEYVYKYTERARIKRISNIGYWKYPISNIGYRILDISNIGFGNPMLDISDIQYRVWKPDVGYIRYWISDIGFGDPIFDISDIGYPI